MTVLLTAASGRTSRYVLRALLPSTSDIRLLVRSQRSIDSLKQNFPRLQDHHFVIVENLLDVQALASACEGIDVVFYNGPTFVSTETAMGIAMIDAASKAGVKHFVFCGVLHPFLTKLINHKNKLPIQEYLTESGLNHTVLQPTSMMQNIDIKEAASSGKLGAWYTPSVLQGFVDLSDVASVAAEVILDPTAHNYASYELVGQNSSLDDVAKVLAHELKNSESGTKTVEAVKLPRERVLQSFTKAKGIQGYVAEDGFERLLFYYDKKGIPGNTNTLRWLLNREPTSWQSHIRHELKLKNTVDFHSA